MAMSTATILIGPEHHGQQMSLEDFETAEAREGHLYELSRGVVTVIDVPGRRHLDQVDAIRQQLSEYRAQTPKVIHRLAGGNECKIPVEGPVSERHPDLAIYKTAPPAEMEGSEIWAIWIPAIVIEVVSPSSKRRDYDEKPEEYLQFGIQEYWIIDANKRQMTILQRSRGRWAAQTIRPPKTYQTHLLPELEFSCESVFEAAEAKKS